ncbi:MAG: hypothetical protein OEM02_14290 [Desulfobulbaceae bacterium]|nr:hypothetical protein [Desulfobulbaceae bacterium]
MAVRETAKVFGLPEREINQFIEQLALSRYAPNEQSVTKTQLQEPWPQILELAKRITGIPRYLSVHPGGVIITPRPISDYVPIQRANKNVPIIQWEKDGAEEAGLVKIDLLGNRSLGVIRDALHQLRDNGQKFDENSWDPEDDPDTRQTVSQGRTMGCFYIESPAMRLLQEKADKGDFEHLVIHSSIIRPAANELIREYLRRLHGGKWEPLHPILNGVLEETYGIMVYQEDVSRVAVKFGFSPTDGDRLRKIMSKKDKEKTLLDYRERFFSCGRELKISEAVCGEIWQMMLSFQGYSFCKPHSASYAKVSFQAAFLKTHYPAEFMAAVISNQGGYYSAFAYVSEARRLGLVIKRPDVNQSRISWHGRGNELRVGFMAIKHFSRNTMKKIIALRAQQPFSSAEDFFHRVNPDEEEARSLIQAGGMDSFTSQTNPDTPAERTQLLWLLAHRQHTRGTGKGMSPTLFNEPTTLPELPPEDPLQRLRNEYRALGFLCAYHPIVLFNQARKRLNTLPARHLMTMPNKKVRFLGWFITGKVVGTKQGKPMEFLTFEDETGPVECTFFPKVYLRHRHLLHRDGPLLLEGIMEEDFGVLTMNVTRASLALK